MSKDEAEKLDLDLPDLAYALSQLALKVFMGKEVETEEFTVQLQVPKEIVEVLKTVSERDGVALEALLSNLASRGLDLSLQLDLNAAKKAQEQAQQPPPQPETPGPQVPGLPPELAAIFNGGVVNVPQGETTGLQGLQKVLDGLGQLGDLAKKLEEVQKVVEHVDQPKTKKDTE
jgi:hypothetical protein